MSVAVHLMSAFQPYLDPVVKPAAKPMINASKASMTASSASKKTFLLMPKYRLCGGRTRSRRAPRLAFVG